MRRYSIILSQGFGVPIDKRKSAEYCKMAADKGDMEALLYYYSMMIPNANA